MIILKILRAVPFLIMIAALAVTVYLSASAPLSAGIVFNAGLASVLFANLYLRKTKRG